MARKRAQSTPEGSISIMELARICRGLGSEDSRIDRTVRIVVRQRCLSLTLSDLGLILDRGKTSINSDRGTTSVTLNAVRHSSY